MIPGDNFIGVGFCLSSGELIYMFNIFMYLCSCTCIICNIHVHVDMSICRGNPSRSTMEL